MKFFIALTTALATAPVFAHEGHGLVGSHWHATDALGFVGVAAVIGIAIWMSRK